MTRSDLRQPDTKRGAVLCIGAAAVDRTYRLNAPLLAGTSNPVSGHRGFGGVARNVAEALARLGSAVSLLTLVGHDADGLALVENLRALGVETGSVVRVAGCETASYLAVLTLEGELALGLADMAILDGLTPELLHASAESLAAADWVFADCNASAGLMAGVADPRRRHRYRLAVDPVSVAKSAHLPDDLHGIDLLVLNRDEAGAYLGRRGLAGLDPEASAAALLAAGAAMVVLTLGTGGALAADRDSIGHVAAVPATAVDVTGAGDSLIAAVLHALMNEERLTNAVAFGCRAAAHTVASLDSVNSALRELMASGGAASVGESRDPDRISAASP